MSRVISAELGGADSSVVVCAEPPHTAARTAQECLAKVAAHHGVDLPADRLQHAYATDGGALATDLLLRMAREAGLRAKAASLDWGALCRLGEAYPAIVRLTNENWIVVLGAGQGANGVEAVTVFDPLADRQHEPLIIDKDRFCARWAGEVVLTKRENMSSDSRRTFGLRWFVPELLRQWRLFGNVALAAILLYALGLVLPIFFQLVIDKVLVHESFTTLYVLTAGATAALAFDAIFGFLRRYLLLYATNRVDIRVATKTFGHLLGLPVTFFEHISAGVLVKHMQQAARIREFLTGRLFLTMLDALSLFVFIPVLALYSIKLTCVVLAFTAISATVVTLLMGPFRRRLYELYQAEGARQALLVETVHGMRTVKSLAMEPVQSRVWDQRCAQSVTMRFGVEKISAVAQAVTGFLEKMMTLGIIALGALDVFSGEMTIGALVAFNMLAGRVSGPLVQLVTMVHEYQEVALAVKMLGEVMNQKPERDGKSDGLRPDLAGKIEFESVSFRYGPEGAPALDQVSVSIAPGSIFGIVGRSGSGKTTLTRLISGMYPVQQGLLRIDGYDARELDLSHLRRNLGVVLQDNFLFRGTVRENIACVKPDATFAEVVRAAQLAGADEFIERLPRGFDTMLEEEASNLSGGQKQRLAIARALITNPRILILDEATSALDSESEMIIRRNLRRLAAGRTVIIVSHRLSMLAEAAQILVIDRGRVVDIDRHDHLLSKCTIYRHLWNQQTKQVA
ncbi:peptidase domain-containing ABC transporter [Bradyrhizobium sp. WSM1253]|uniref:peptidase domain-containing ABC transporter n=1 Tax=Bradyrhizobium sp. WSM1253 TaxID=319003 RepID=UPI00025D1426|nr:peptidase domain-containing ABC transporter [Bradyrhizobium sp. WSM1253]EIG57073.1 ABC-type bacteriocin/lantibiotic exporter with N-terminal double-glycine peptidase domain [Bradyrhizobium sp. WSM1253]